MPDLVKLKEIWKANKHPTKPHEYDTDPFPLLRSIGAFRGENYFALIRWDPLREQYELHLRKPTVSSTYIPTSVTLDKVTYAWFTSFFKNWGVSEFHRITEEAVADKPQANQPSGMPPLQEVLAKPNWLYR